MEKKHRVNHNAQFTFKGEFDCRTMLEKTDCDVFSVEP